MEHDPATTDVIALRIGRRIDPASLADTVRALQSGQRMLASMAEVIDDRSNGRSRRARAFLRTVRLGPVAGDGRELAVVVPVESPEAEGLFPRPEGPFARQVTAGLHDGVRAARDAATAPDGGEEFRLGAGLGLTAATCRALLALAGEHAEPFELAFTWATSRPEPDRTEPLAFAPKLLDALRRGAKELDRPEVLADVVLRGKVTELRLDPERTFGTVGVRGHFASDPLRKPHQADVRVPLPAYHRALRAHSDVRAVEARGSLELRRSRWLLHATALTVIDDP